MAGYSLRAAFPAGLRLVGGLCPEHLKRFSQGLGGPAKGAQPQAHHQKPASPRLRAKKPPISSVSFLRQGSETLTFGRSCTNGLPEHGPIYANRDPAERPRLRPSGCLLGTTWAWEEWKKPGDKGSLMDLRAYRDFRHPSDGSDNLPSPHLHHRFGCFLLPSFLSIVRLRFSLESLSFVPRQRLFASLSAFFLFGKLWTAGLRFHSLRTKKKSLLRRPARRSFFLCQRIVFFAALPAEFCFLRFDPFAVRPNDFHSTPIPCPGGT
jgi:hypothetical protein